MDETTFQYSEEEINKLPKEFAMGEDSFTNKNLPDKSGVYFLFNHSQKLIYIGKANDIRARIAGHFSNSKKKAFGSMPLEEIYHISYILTEDRFEAGKLEANYIKNIPTEYNNTPKERSGEVRMLDVDSKLKDITDETHKFLILFLTMTGLKVSELINISKRDVDLKKNKIFIPSRKYEPRSIPIHNELLPKLKKFIEDKKNNETIFLFKTRARVFQIIRLYFEDYSPNSFRDFFAINFLSQCKNPSGVLILQRLMGLNNLRSLHNYMSNIDHDVVLEFNKTKFFNKEENL